MTSILKVNSPKQGLSNQNKGHLGSMYIYIYYIMCLFPPSKGSDFGHEICQIGCQEMTQKQEEAESRLRELRSYVHGNLCGTMNNEQKAG